MKFCLAFLHRGKVKVEEKQVKASMDGQNSQPAEEPDPRRVCAINEHIIHPKGKTKRKTKTSSLISAMKFKKIPERTTSNKLTWVNGCSRLVKSPAGLMQRNWDFWCFCFTDVRHKNCTFVFFQLIWIFQLIIWIWKHLSKYEVVKKRRKPDVNFTKSGGRITISHLCQHIPLINTISSQQL